jgi:hypothetical protein
VVRDLETTVVALTVVMAEGMIAKEITETETEIGAAVRHRPVKVETEIVDVETETGTVEIDTAVIATAMARTVTAGESVAVAESVMEMAGTVTAVIETKIEPLPLQKSTKGAW